MNNPVITIDPVDILTKTPMFIIMKNGDAYKIGEVDIVESKCVNCGAIRKEHMTFVGGKCNKCWVEGMNAQPKVEEEEIEWDSCNFEGSGFLTQGYWKEVHGGLGFLKLNLNNGRELIYIDVPKDIWESLVKAPSAGKFYNQHVKGQYLQQLDEKDRRENAENSVPVS